MKHKLACFLILAAQPIIGCITLSPALSSQMNTPYLVAQSKTEGQPASVPEIELDPENAQAAEGSDKVTIVGCDNTVWETAAISAGQADLAGTWVGHEQDRTGEWSIAFTYSGRFEMKGPGGDRYEGRYACDGRPTPKILNLYVKESNNSDLVGKTILVIYKVDSNKLTYASSKPGASARPDSFTSGSGTRVFVVNKEQ